MEQVCLSGNVSVPSSGCHDCVVQNPVAVALAGAQTDCRLIPVDIKRFGYMVRQMPYFALHLMQVPVERLRGMDSQA